MTVTETVFIVSTVLNVIGLFIMFSIYRDTNITKVLIGQMHGALGNIGAKIHAQESYLQKLGNAFSDFTNLMENVAEKIEMVISTRQGSMYRTIDGKYAATSLQDLIEKIKKDGMEGEYLSEEELEGLRRLFEDDADRFDDDENDFNPEQGKF